MFQKVMDGLSEGIVVIEEDSRKIVFINRFAKKILGIDKECVGEYCYQCFFHADSVCSDCNKEQQITVNGSILIERKGYSIESDGKRYLVKIFEDITEKIEKQQLVEYNSTLMQAIYEQSNLIPWEYNIQTHTCEFSDKFVKIFHCKKCIQMIPEELSRYSFISPKDVKKVQQAFVDILNGKKEVETEARMIFPTGEKRCRMHMNVLAGTDGKMVLGVIENIESQKELEDCFQLAAAQNQFNAFVYDVKQDVFATLLEGENTNKNYITGFMDRIKKRKEFIHEEDIPVLLDALEAIKHGSKGENRIIRWRREFNEEYRVGNISLVTFFDTYGNVEKLFGTVRDITEQEKRERLYKSQLTYVENYRQSSLAYFEMNVSRNRMLNTNSAYPKLRRGVDAHTIRNWVTIMQSLIPYAEERERLGEKISREKLIREYEKGNNKVIVNAPMKIDDNLVLWTNIEVSLLQNPLNQEIEGFVSIKDITDEQRGIQAARYLIQMDYEIVAVFDKGTGKLQELFNYLEEKNFEQNMELTYEQAAKMIIKSVPLSDRRRLEDFLDFEQLWERVLKEKECTVSFSSIGKDGVEYRKRVLFTKLRKFDDKLLVVVQDVSDIYNEEREKQKILEKALEEAKVAENAKIDFLSRMSHDLRTPLNGILGMTDIAADETNEENIREYLEKIQSSGQLLLSLVNDILDISQLEDNRMKLRLEPYSMKAFLQSVDRIIVEQCKAKSITFIEDFEEISSRWFITDKLRFGQIFMNLLSNAVKYTKEGGKIAFEAKVLEREDRKVKLSICVSDTGIGMSSEFVKQAFDPFSQENTKGIDERIGSGLGLSIVKQLVDLMEGTIDVESTLGVGTSINVTLVLEETKPVVLEEEKKVFNGKELKDKRILLAEDQPLNAKIVTKLLNKKGAIVDFAENGQKAVSTFLESEEGYYDAILMDVRMPKMDGIEATKIIREHVERKDSDIPIIATTANAFVEDKVACISAGMNEHISKPINATELFTCLGKYLV